MPIANERGKLIFRKMDRELLRLSSEQEADNVHGFRTTTRRLQTLLELTPGRHRNQKKLMKMLDRIRRRAGKVRDIDVQLAALRSLKVPLEPRRKTQLMQHLIEARAGHERKLRKLLKPDNLCELRKRLRRTAREIQLDSIRDPLALAREILESVAPSNGPVTEESLHRCRLAVKRARYAAEFATKSAESTQFMAQLKRLQDTLGNWHDWMTLTDTAREQFGEMNQSSLVAALHNVTRGKFRQAAEAVSGWQVNGNGTRSRSGKNVVKTAAPATQVETAA
ncbi:MAG TPA: CHAD domain-containing protein [Candidatus Sulfotelmatobacter sp.]|nr:CHAD domain-containing protein [Candidatus Sulfotelmatobacter sp.]